MGKRINTTVISTYQSLIHVECAVLPTLREKFGKMVTHCVPQNAEEVLWTQA